VETEARLVDDLMDMTRLTRGELELDLETIDAHAAIHDVLAMFQTQIDFHKLHVTVALSAGRNLVRADAGRFQQVLMHMMSNAVKFTPDYGAIALRSFNVQDRMNIEISDTGVGIDTQELPRLFNAFEQEEEAINRRFGGLGLGLTIVKALVEMHRGRIAVMSAGRDRGSTFTLDLPTVASPVTQTPQGNTSRKTAYRILLVEDHADTRQALMVLLRSFGCVVSTAATVKEAVEMGDREDFDLLVSDIGLPDGSGIDVMRYMREHHHVKGIAMSGFGQDEDLRRSREAGFAAHLIKPISFQNLQETIQRVAG
jgi:hypothetical protein